MTTPWNSVGRYGTVGLELVITMGLLTWGGHWIDDRYLGGHGWGLGVGFVLGVAVAFRNLLRTAGHMERDIEREEAKNPAGSHWNVDSSWVHKDGHDPNWVYPQTHDAPGAPEEPHDANDHRSKDALSSGAPSSDAPSSEDRSKDARGSRSPESKS